MLNLNGAFLVIRNNEPPSVELLGAGENESRRNAALIAAAPRMLAALEAAYNTLANDEAWEGSELIEQLESAIEETTL